MYLTKRFHASKIQDLADFLSGGRLISQGKNLSNGAGSPNVSVPVASGSVPDFSLVEAGDRIHISGEASATVFLVLTKTDNQNLILDNSVVAAHAATGHYKVLRGGIDPSKVHTITEDSSGGGWTVIFESDTFYVP